jgi:hypothetical protein
MKHLLHAGHAPLHARAVGYRADLGREWRRRDIETRDVIVQIPQGADQRLAEMTGASRNQNFHAASLFA